MNVRRFTITMAALLLLALLALPILNVNIVSGLPTDPVSITSDTDLASKAA
jgi:hypothetical protein